MNPRLRQHPEEPGAPCLAFETWDRTDAAGNLTSDSFHSYTYDAEGNVTQVDGGATAKYTYNALNQRVHIEQAGDTTEFVFNLNGQRSSYWDVTAGYETQGQTYWGTEPVEFYEAGVAHFQHQDWEGTERMRTTYNGSVEGSFSSLPFGDGFSTSGADNDPYHFAGLDFDYNSNTDHAQFRQYSEAQGRWMSPDPWDGSYDLANPQSFNRYSYVLNNPLSMTDPTGQGPEGAAGCLGGPVGCAVGFAAAAIFDDWLFNSIFGGPSFHGSLKPRPEGTGNPDWANADGSFGETLGLPSDVNWSKINPGIAGALGLPDAGCEFGACGTGPMGFGSNNSGTPFTDHWGLDSVFELLGWKIPYLNHVNDKNTRLFSTHYCGPGGGGSVSPGLDAACAAHDACYTRAGVGVWDNWNLNLSPDKQAAIKNCNQNLCNAVRSLKGGGAWAVNQTFTNVWGVYTCQ